ncbi:MAG TPA: hypothetical protein VE843_01505 [Ktedonobacteraceae bacterium]|nr:hypothetical protein [Ktedonobacteraceae bacterium]
MFAEEFIVIDADSPLWSSARPLLDLAVRLDQNEETYSCNGWNKRQIRGFLDSLPSRSSVIVGVWETIPEKEGSSEHENLFIGLVCEIIDGEINSIRTFDALTLGGLKPSNQLEPSIDDAQEIIGHVEKLVAPVTWALFTEKSTWDEWLLANLDDSIEVDKGKQLIALVHQGRCVLMGRQTKYH